MSSYKDSICHQAKLQFVGSAITHNIVSDDSVCNHRLAHGVSTQLQKQIVVLGLLREVVSQRRQVRERIGKLYILYCGLRLFISSPFCHEGVNLFKVISEICGAGFPARISWNSVMAGRKARPTKTGSKQAGRREDVRIADGVRRSPHRPCRGKPRRSSTG